MRASEKEIICRKYCCTHWAAWFGYPMTGPTPYIKHKKDRIGGEEMIQLTDNSSTICLYSMDHAIKFLAPQPPEKRALSLSNSSLIVISLNSLSISLPPFEDSTSLRSSFVGARWLAALHVDHLLDYAIKFRVQDPIRLQAAPVRYNGFNMRVPCLLPILPLLKECNESTGGEEPIGEVSFIF